MKTTWNRDARDTRVLRSVRRSEGATEASTESVKVRAIENVFAIRGEDIEAKQKLSLPQIRSQIEQDLPGIEKEVEELTGARSKLDTKVKEYEQKIAELTPFLDPGGSRTLDGVPGISLCSPVT